MGFILDLILSVSGMIMRMMFHMPAAMAMAVRVLTGNLGVVRLIVRGDMRWVGLIHWNAMLF